MRALGVFPGSSVATAMRGAHSFLPRNSLLIDGPLFFSCKVALEDDADCSANLRVLGEHPSEQGEASLEDGPSGAKVFAIPSQDQR